MNKKLNEGKLIGIKTSVFTIFNQEKYDQKAIPTAWQEFFAKARGTELANTTTYYGASIPSMSLDAPMDYFAGAIVSIDTEVPAGFASVDIPAGNYFEHIHIGPITNIASSYQKAYMETMPASGKEMRPAPHLEIYNSEKDPMSDDYEMTIAIPVN
jgi:AraC family transcriptional regulator